MAKQDLFRLAAVLYADNNYEVSPRTIHKKIVESILLDNQNNELSIDQITERIDSQYNFIFTEDEIEVIAGDDTAFETRIERKNKFVKLTPGRFSVLTAKIQNNTIEYFINEFVQLNSEFARLDVKSCIYKFLYELFTINIAGFAKLLDYKKDISQLEGIEVGKFNEVEKNIINSFLQWESDGKNKAIFDISSYALEYCLITNDSKAKQIHLTNLRNKIFYLDTNIIFRAIGINGDSRKIKTSTFLQKFNEANETLLISKFTHSEFISTVNFHVGKIGENLTPKVNSKVFKRYSNQSEFFDYFHSWRQNRQNANLELFRAHVLNEYETFRKRYEIKVDYTIPYDEKDEKIIEELTELSRDIFSHKHKENPNTPFENAEVDARNVYFLSKKRGNSNHNIFETKYFFISSDQSLRRWDYTRQHTAPIVILPSQWMSILLRYVSRTKDDFKSFVSFLNLPQSESQISSENLQLVLVGISEITQDVEQQSSIIEIMIAQKFEGVLSKGLSNEEIINNSTSKAKSILEEKVRHVTEAHEKLAKRFESHVTQSSETIKNLEGKNTEILEIKTKEVKELSSVIEQQKSEKDALMESIKSAKLKKGIFRWRLPAYIMLAVGIFIIVSWVLLFCFTDSWYNYACAIAKWIDSHPENSTRHTLLIALVSSSLGAVVWITIFCYNRIWNKRKRIEEENSILLMQ